MSEKLVAKIKKIPLANIIAIKNVNQSEVILVFTDIFLMYVAMKEIVKYDIELIPKGKPITTSLISPAKKMWPFPKIVGLLRTQK